MRLPAVMVLVSLVLLSLRADAGAAPTAPDTSARKKPANIIVVVERSGRMKGPLLEEARAGARAFLNAVNPQSDVSLILFEQKPSHELGPVRKERGGRVLTEAVDTMTAATGGTGLYLAIFEALDVARARASSMPGRVHAVVVITAGQDDVSPPMLKSVLLGHPGEPSSPTPAPASPPELLELPPAPPDVKTLSREEAAELLRRLPVLEEGARQGSGPEVPVYILELGGSASTDLESLATSTRGEVIRPRSGEVRAAARKLASRF
jgi:hypothetical protein